MMQDEQQTPAGETRQPSSMAAALGRARGWLGTLSSVVATIKTIVSNAADIHDKGPAALALLAPLAFYLGEIVGGTVVCFLLFGLAATALEKLMKIDLPESAYHALLVASFAYVIWRVFVDPGVQYASSDLGYRLVMIAVGAVLAAVGALYVRMWWKGRR